MKIMNSNYNSIFKCSTITSLTHREHKTEYGINLYRCAKLIYYLLTQIAYAIFSKHSPTI